MSTEEKQSTEVGTGTGGGPVAPRRGKAAAARDNTRLLAAAILGGVVGVFALVNLDEVQVDWVVGDGSSPLILVIALSLAAGFVLGLILGRRGRKG